MKNLTTNQLGRARVSSLNKLEIFKKSKLSAVNPQWMADGSTYCEIYNKSNKRRVKIKTHLLFQREDFLGNPETYLQGKGWFQELIK